MEVCHHSEQGVTGIGKSSEADQRACLREKPVAKGKLGRVGDTLLAFLANKVPPFEELIAQPEVISGFNIEQKYLAALTVAEAITKTSPNIQKSKKYLCFVAEKDDRELISALFAFLQKQRRREVFIAVKDKPQILKALELTGKALL